MPLRKIESALPHPLAREEDRDTVRRQLDLQHDDTLRRLDDLVLENAPRRVVWSDQSRSVEAGVLAWAMSAVAQLAETEAGTDETARQLRLTRETALVEEDCAAGLPGHALRPGRGGPPARGTGPATRGAGGGRLVPRVRDRGPAGRGGRDRRARAPGDPALLPRARAHGLLRPAGSAGRRREPAGTREAAPAAPGGAFRPAGSRLRAAARVRGGGRARLRAPTRGPDRPRRALGAGGAVPHPRDATRRPRPGQAAAPHRCRRRRTPERERPRWRSAWPGPCRATTRAASCSSSSTWAARPSTTSSGSSRPRPACASTSAGRCEIPVLRRSRPSGFWLLSAGGGAASSEPAPPAARLATLLRATDRVFDYVVADCPPVLDRGHGAALLDHLDGFVFVVRSRRTARETVQRAAALLRPDRIVGVVLNAQRDYFRRRLPSRRCPRGSRRGASAPRPRTPWAAP